MPFLSEVAGLYRFFWKTPKSDRAVVFYAEHDGYYANFEGLIEELIKIHGAPFCYVTSDPSDPILQRHHPNIRVFYLATLLPLFMAFVDCRAFVMTLTELNQHHLKRSMNDVHYVYVFHSLHSVHLFYPNGAFDHYDSILCVGPHQIEELRKQEELYHLKPKTLIEAGYYRVERIHRAFCNRQAAQSKPSSGNRVILIAPSWGARNILEAHGETVVSALVNAGFAVVVRPHPETRRRFPRIVESFERKFRDDPRVTLEQSVSTDDSLLQADVLVTDWSAVALEYAFGTERPVLYVDTSLKHYNDQYGELGIEPLELRLRSQIGMVLPADEIPSIAQAVEHLIRDRSGFEARIRELRAQCVFAFGRSSEIGARHIHEIASHSQG